MRVDPRRLCFCPSNASFARESARCSSHFPLLAFLVRCQRLVNGQSAEDLQTGTCADRLAEPKRPVYPSWALILLESHGFLPKWSLAFSQPVQLRLNLAAVAASVGPAPRHQGAVLQDSSKSAKGGLDLLDVLQLLLHLAAVTAVH